MKMKLIALVAIVLASGMRFSALPVFAGEAPPAATVVSATTLDTDHNGQLDQIEVVFSDDIDGTLLSADQFVVDGCTYDRFFTVDTATLADLNNVVTLALVEDSSMDTGLTCMVTVSGATDIYSNSVDGSVETDDGAAPVIRKIRYTDDDHNGKIERFIIDYSEELNSETSASSSFFSIVEGGDFSGISVAPSESLEVGAWLGWISLPLNEGSEMDTHEDSGALVLATLEGYGVSDLVGNTDDSVREQRQATFEDIAKPEIKSVTYQDQDSDGKVDYATLTFTETVDGGSSLWPNQLSIQDDAGFTGYQFTTDSEDLISESTNSVSMSMIESSVISTHTDSAIILGSGNEEGSYYLLDMFGNGANSSPENFAVIETVDGASPVLVSSAPADGGTLSDLNANLVLRFSEDLSTDTVSPSSVRMQEEIGWDIDEPTDYSVVTINPDGPLTIDSTYHILLNCDDRMASMLRVAMRRGCWNISDMFENGMEYDTVTFTTIAPRGTGATGLPVQEVIPPTAPAGQVLGTTDTVVVTTPVIIADTDGNGVKAGDYIRGSSWTTVYYVDASLTRHPLMDHQTYFTYENAWDRVIVLADEKLRDYPMGRLILPKAGTVLVKIDSMTDDVFALEAGVANTTILRRISDEVTASAKFGSNWADYVIDLSVVCYPHFVRGVDMDSAFVVDMSKMKTRVSLNNN